RVLRSRIRGIRPRRDRPPVASGPCGRGPHADPRHPLGEGPALPAGAGAAVLRGAAALRSRGRAPRVPRRGPRTVPQRSAPPPHRALRGDRGLVVAPLRRGARARDPAGRLMLNSIARAAFTRLFTPPARLLLRIGLTPDA